MINTLIICPHADDETFGVHGYIQRFQHLENISVLVLSSGQDYEKSIFRRKTCCDILNGFELDSYSIGMFEACSFDEQRAKISKRIELAVEIFTPNKILIPCEYELHQDHKLINHLCKIASKPSRHPHINEIIEYSVPESEQFSSTYYDTILNLTQLEYDLKIIDAYKYSTEYIPNIPNSEKFRTLFRRL